MNDVNVGVIGLGNVGSGTFPSWPPMPAQIALKLGFRLRVTAVCSWIDAKERLPPASET